MASFAIEVPGEANPLTQDTLVRALSSAASDNQTQVQTGTKQLQQWETSARFFQYLQSAFLNYQLPLPVRYLAILQLKNGVDKYWRKTAQNAVPDEDKEVVRSRLAKSILNEIDDRLALHVALVIAKIARYEYPRTWPEAISVFLMVIKSPGAPPTQLARALLALLHIVKELSTARLQVSRQSLQSATPDLIAVVGGAYVQFVDAWLSELDAEGMLLSLAAIKLIRRLLIFGYDYPHRDQHVRSFWSLTMQHLSLFVERHHMCRNGSDANLLSLLDRHVLQLAKLHHEMARSNAAAFALLPNTVRLINAYWGLVKSYGADISAKDADTRTIAVAAVGCGGDEDDVTFDEKIALKGLLIVRACVKMVFQPAQTFKSRDPEARKDKAEATGLIRSSLLTESFIRDMLETLIFQLFVIRPSDMRKWTEEPEEWEQREEGIGNEWEFSARPCAEKLFIDISINYREIVVGPMLTATASIANGADKDTQYKDSIYTALGLAADVLHEHLDFDKFMRSTLVPEMRNHEIGANILRRRVAIVLSQWVMHVPDPSKSLVYEIYQHLLNDEDGINDQVVLTTAGRHFADIANDWNFQVEKFLPFAEKVIAGLMTLIRTVELPETKLAIFNSVSVAVERLDNRIAPFAEEIVSLLPSLWAQSEDEHMMRQAILTILTRLINAMRGSLLMLHDTVLSIVAIALRPDSEESVYLLEDALELWAAVLAQTPTDCTPPELLNLISLLLPILEVGTESLGKALEIINAYVVLAPEHVFSDAVRRRLFPALACLIGEVNSEANGPVCNIIETLIRAAQKLGGEAAVTQMASDLVQSDFLPRILHGLRGSWAAHCTTGPKADRAPVDGIMETDYFAVLARLSIGSLSAFCQVCQSSQSNTFEETMKWMLEEWFAHFENIGDPSRRKLMCLALTKLLETGQPFILLSLQSLMSMWTDVVMELREDAQTLGHGGCADSLVYTATHMSSNVPDGPEAPEAQRHRQLMQEDEVHTIAMPEWIKHYLQLAVAHTPGGETEFRNKWIANVDGDVVKAFSELGIM